MKTLVTFFKSSGKYYADETIEIPGDAKPWDARKHIEAHLDGRMYGMTAVIIDGPWGYPLLIPNLGAPPAEVR